MAYVAIADRDVHPHDPTTFITKYIWSQDHKVIAIQYSLTAIAVGLVALVLSGMMRLQLGFPDTFALITPNNYLQFILEHFVPTAQQSSADCSEPFIVTRQFLPWSSSDRNRCPAARHGRLA